MRSLLILWCRIANVAGAGAAQEDKRVTGPSNLGRSLPCVSIAKLHDVISRGGRGLEPNVLSENATLSYEDH
ncbi:hypothetical protein BDN72DRAFT_604878 [Pluteus cervinus]|uniref:Uncharacterized protein n=1 Tax=Pluteus cervinus TaxID=181527 RepID=A0ACD3BBJ1_9AGAR|nr:hypothetical protein BDN72DRAFT_604878 [Pluteus cervinus]